jgi:hypothetical protein
MAPALAPGGFPCHLAGETDKWLLKKCVVILSGAKNPSPRVAFSPEAADRRDSSVAFGSLRTTFGGSADIFNGLITDNG